MAHRYTIEELWDLPFGTRVWYHSIWPDDRPTGWAEKLELHYVGPYPFFEFHFDDGVIYADSCRYGLSWEAWDGPEGEGEEANA